MLRKAIMAEPPQREEPTGPTMMRVDYATRLQIDEIQARLQTLMGRKLNRQTVLGVIVKTAATVPMEDMVAALVREGW